MHAAVTLNPSSFVYLQNHVLVEGVRQFKRMFCAYNPCIYGFKHCKLVIYLDGTLLYGKYRSVLLTAKAVDGNNAILPLAFALVKKESKDNWEYFMKMLRFIVVIREKMFALFLTVILELSMRWSKNYGVLMHIDSVCIMCLVITILSLIMVP